MNQVSDLDLLARFKALDELRQEGILSDEEIVAEKRWWADRLRPDQDPDLWAPAEEWLWA